MTRSKYGSKKTVIDGFTFDSLKESRRYSELMILQRAKLISNLELQAVFVLAPAAILNGRKKPALRYVADFIYTNSDGVQIIEDVKSKATAENRAFRIKQHLMKTVWNLDITLI